MRQAEDREINIQAIERLLGLDDALREYGYTDRERESILVRLMLCFFSQDTGVFGSQSFVRFLEDHRELTPAARLQVLFAALRGERGPETPPELMQLPVLGGEIFAEEFTDRGIGEMFILSLAECAGLAWGTISPAIFGAMFQEIMNQHDRREWGAYYTSEEVIDRLIDPLFMEELLSEREACRGSRRRLAAFQDKLSRLTFLDPACGCGNFLIRIYERLRRLELSVIDELYDTRQRVLDISLYCHVSPVQFLGIEQEMFQAQIARIGMWIAERQLDMEAAERFGVEHLYPTMVSPLGIRCGNALTVDWGTLVNRDRLSYIVGNPPFSGARIMTPEQKLDMKQVFRDTRAAGNLDYVAAWYRRTAEFISGTRIRAAFVSTNSICQGEQATLLWKELTGRFSMQIDFAWKTFVWGGGGRGQAKVHCVIVGFSDADIKRRGEQYSAKRRLYDASGCRMTPHINAYLQPAEDVWIRSRRTPLADVPHMVFGNMANDGGHLILTSQERAELLRERPERRAWIRPFLGSEEFINGKERWCLWLDGVPDEAWKPDERIRERVEQVKEFRLKSPRSATRLLALSPHRFGEVRQPEEGQQILVPRVSSFRREYIPIGFVPADWIASDAVFSIPEADEVLFALLTSKLHMLWVRTVAGRLKSDYRYSASLVYNNFPFPDPEEEERQQLREAAGKILEVRETYPGASLARLYDPETMPSDLREAHRALDRLTERICGLEGYTEEEQLVWLFRQYAQRSGGEA